MKTKLLAMMMMGLATVGSIGGVATASDGWNGSGGLGANIGVSGISGVSGTNEGRKGSKLLDVIQKGINWVLGMLALLTLCIVLWGGFQMVTAAGDDNKYKKGMSILKHAAIGLAIIMLSWIIVSVIFWLVGQVGGASTGGTTS